MAPLFRLCPSLMPGIIDIEVVRDDGATLSLLVDQFTSVTNASVIGFNADNTPMSDGLLNVTPEQYLHALAEFLGYTVTPPSKLHPNATREELLPIIMQFANDAGKLDSRWIQAMKAVREYTGWGLKAAKDAIDPYKENRNDSGHW